MYLFFFFFKQKTSYEMRISDWSSDVCSSDLTNDLVYRSAVLNTLARGARHLDKGADKAPAGLPRIAAWIGVIASALVVQGGRSEESRVGKEGVSKCRTRWSAEPNTKKASMNS